MSEDGRLRLLSFTTLFPNPIEPARGIFVRNRLAAIAPHADLLVVAPVNAGRNPAVLRTPFRRRDPAGFEVIHPRFAVLPGLLKGWDAAFLHGEVAPQVGGVLREFRATLMDTHYAYPDGAAASRFAQALGIPFVLSVRGSDLEVLARDEARRGAIASTLREAGAVVAVSRSLERRAQDLGATPDRIHVIPNGVDTERFHPRDREEARRELGIPPAERVVLVVARLEPVKGIDLLVRALGALRLRQEGTPPRAYIIGDGPERPALEALIRANGVADDVRLLGGRAPETLPAWYGAADLVCLLSHSEGCPNVVLEALACGKPVVATKVGGIPDLVREGENGLLIRERDPGHVADRLVQALATQWDEAFIASGARRNWDTVASEQLLVYRRVVMERSR